jgi:hypothetical protein
MLSRRGFFGGLAALAAPAIIRTPGLLMPIRMVASPMPDLDMLQIKRLLLPGLVSLEGVYRPNYWSKLWLEGDTVRREDIPLDDVFSPQDLAKYGRVFRCPRTSA